MSKDINSQKLLEELMIAANSESRDHLSMSHATEIVSDLFEPRWLIVQKAMLEVINGEFNKLGQVKPTVDNLGEMAKIQGTIAGMRRFWDLIVDEVGRAVTDEEKKNDAS